MGKDRFIVLLRDCKAGSVFRKRGTIMDVDNELREQLISNGDADYASKESTVKNFKPPKKTGKKNNV